MAVLLFNIGDEDRNLNDTFATKRNKEREKILFHFFKDELDASQ